MVYELIVDNKKSNEYEETRMKAAVKSLMKCVPSLSRTS
jgi:hypothetical protein